MATQASWAPQGPALDNHELSVSGLPRIVGNSAALRRVLKMVRIVAPTDASIAEGLRQRLPVHDEKRGIDLRASAARDRAEPQGCPVHPHLSAVVTTIGRRINAAARFPAFLSAASRP